MRAAGGRFIFIFLDGVGIGRAGKSNPFFTAGCKYLPFYESSCLLPDRTPVKAIDACLGVAGMPMSASGQTSLFTGKNIPKMLNRHKDSYPDNLMRRIIKNGNILSLLKKISLKVRFMNSYPDYAHFYTENHIRILNDGRILFSEEFPLHRRGTISVTTCMMLSTGMTPFDREDILNERALFHDFTNRSIAKTNRPLPEFSPGKAAEILFKASARYDFTLYEFFQTDMYAHGSSFSECVGLIEKLDRFVKKLIFLLHKDRDTLLITSDHGNMEDLSMPFHTTNPVPLITWGHRSDELRENIDSLTAVTPAVLSFFGSKKIFF